MSLYRTSKYESFTGVEEFASSLRDCLLTPKLPPPDLVIIHADFDARSGPFMTGLWTRLMPQASEAVPFVRHAIIAVGKPYFHSGLRRGYVGELLGICHTCFQLGLGSSASRYSRYINLLIDDSCSKSDHWRRRPCELLFYTNLSPPFFGLGTKVILGITQSPLDDFSQRSLNNSSTQY